MAEVEAWAAGVAEVHARIAPRFARSEPRERVCLRASVVGAAGEEEFLDAGALCIPTAQWGHPSCGPVSARGFVSGAAPWGSLTSMEWKSLGLLELSTLPTIGPEHWIPWVWAADVLLVDGGDAAYLCHWMREAGMTDLLPSLSDMVWVGVSAGSMVMTPRIGADFVQWPSAPDDRTLGVVDFSIFPHLDVFPENTIEEAERWARQIGGQAYALDERDGNESGRRRRGGHLRGAMENVSLTAAERGSALRDARSGRDT